MSTVAETYLDSVVFRFRGAKALGDKALAQLSAADLAWSPGPESNSIAVIVQHLHGNMMSRWTDFLTTDGDKPWRDRDGEFVEPGALDRDALLRKWEEGWACLFRAIESLQPDDVMRDVTIRGETLSALDAINRQLAHVPYHVGQIVYLARMRRGGAWQTLSIARGESKNYQPAKRD
ncbi:MAG: DUF1572 domain-containing protein [Candidatus Hydrogenedentes bacterium]|nr:DUF1572 domain-containing protein [Candidatus Hydrogenedentota bacterium]